MPRPARRYSANDARGRRRGDSWKGRGAEPHPGDAPASGPARRRRRRLRSPQRRPAPVQDNGCAAGLAAVRPWRQRAAISARRYTGIGPGYAGNGGPRYEPDALRGPERDASRRGTERGDVARRGAARQGLGWADKPGRGRRAVLFKMKRRSLVIRAVTRLRLPEGL